MSEVESLHRREKFLGTTPAIFEGIALAQTQSFQKSSQKIEVFPVFHYAIEVNPLNHNFVFLDPLTTETRRGASLSAAPAARKLMRFVLCG